MSKKDPVLIALWKSPEKVDAFLLKTYGVPKEPQSRYEVSETSFTDRETGLPQSLERTAEQMESVSHTQRTDALTSLHLESGENESVKLSPAWLLYLAYWDVVAEALSHKDNGAELKRLTLTDARSRYWEQPPDVLRPMNAALGTPAEFRERWKYRELDIRLRCVANRRTPVIEIWRLTPDEPDDWDEADE